VAIREEKEGSLRPERLRTHRPGRGRSQTAGAKAGHRESGSARGDPVRVRPAFFFKEFSRPTVVYWHDTGHAQIKENLGFISHRALLESMRERLFGFHLHDVQPPGRDHRAPGTGCVDWTALKPIVRPADLKVFEFSPSLTSAEPAPESTISRRSGGLIRFPG